MNNYFFFENPTITKEPKQHSFFQILVKLKKQNFSRKYSFFRTLKVDYSFFSFFFWGEGYWKKKNCVFLGKRWLFDGFNYFWGCLLINLWRSMKIRQPPKFSRAPISNMTLPGSHMRFNVFSCPKLQGIVKRNYFPLQTKNYKCCSTGLRIWKIILIQHPKRSIFRRFIFYRFR